MRLEKIEVSIRTQLSLIMGDEAGIYWFENPANFRNASRHATLLTNLQTECAGAMMMPLLASNSVIPITSRQAG